MTVHPRSAPLAREAVPVHRGASAAVWAQRRAWASIVVAFGVWCLLVGWAAVSVNTWRKTAYSSPPAQLTAKRGIVLYQGPRDSLPLSVNETAILEEGGIVEVPSSSEAVIQLGVDSSVVRLRSGTRVRLSSMRVGRFNRELTQVRIDQLQGAATYAIAGELPDGREVEVRTPQTLRPQDGVKLTKGEYLVWVQGDLTRLIAYSGQAKAQVEDAVYRLRDARWISFGPDENDKPRVNLLPEQLLRNRSFGRGLSEGWSPIDLGEKGRPDVGGTRTLADAEVAGRAVRTLRFFRDTAKDTHNETGLHQEINRDVWAFRSLNLSGLVKVSSASLDGGGYAGSEYPLMFRIQYVAENGGTYTWTHGFYVQNGTNRPTDMGEEIRPGEWFQFRIDLMQLKERPAYIGSLEVLASGHDFDSQVADVELAVE
jgi:hypothetical protein